MTVASNVSAIEASIVKARAWKRDAPTEFSALRDKILSDTFKRNPNDPDQRSTSNPDGMPTRTPAQNAFIANYDSMSSTITSIGTKLEEVCKELEKYTNDTAWVSGFTTDEGSWQAVYGVAYQGYESTNTNTLKAYQSWKGKDADQYRSNAFDQHYAIYNGAAAAENLKKTCKDIVTAAEDFYKTLADEAKFLNTNPPDISSTYNLHKLPVSSTLDVWWEAITDPGGIEDNIGKAITAFITAANSAFRSMEVQDVPNRPPERHSATQNIEAPWPALKVN